MPLFSGPSNASNAVWEPAAADSRLAHTFGAADAGVFTGKLDGVFSN